jgi:hypothetical protein
MTGRHRRTAAEAARRIAECAPTAQDYRDRGETPPWVTLCGLPQHAGMGPHGHGDGSEYGHTGTGGQAC